MLTGRVRSYLLAVRRSVITDILYPPVLRI
jgi:hypothetical protein